VRAVLSWGIDNAPDKAEAFVFALIGLLRGKGGFRSGSSNYAGDDAIFEAREAFRLEGYVLSDEGELYASTLDNLSGVQLTAALEAYVRRAQRGSEDGALLVGTGKDLLEATASHIITEKYGHYSNQANFPTLLGQAFTALGLATRKRRQRLARSRNGASSGRCMRRGVPSMRCVTRPAQATAGRLCRPSPTTKHVPQSN